MSGRRHVKGRAAVAVKYLYMATQRRLVAIEPSNAPEERARTRERFLSHLRDENFLLYSQATVSASQSTSDLGFLEVLIRHKDEEEGLLPPGSFFPILEELGLMPLLDRWILSRVLWWCRETRAAPGTSPNPRCSVHLSLDTIRDGEAFAAFARAAIERSAVKGAAIAFEIAEADALAYAPVLVRMMPPLRAAGCHFVLGRFTGGDAAFRLAALLGFAFAKLDGSFAASTSRGLVDDAPLAAIVQRCRRVGLRVIASQVEDATVLVHLRLLKIDYAQGFGIERPRALVPQPSP